MDYERLGNGSVVLCNITEKCEPDQRKKRNLQWAEVSSPNIKRAELLLSPSRLQHLTCVSLSQTVQQTFCMWGWHGWTVLQFMSLNTMQIKLEVYPRAPRSSCLSSIHPINQSITYVVDISNYSQPDYQIMQNYSVGVQNWHNGK